MAPQAVAAPRAPRSRRRLLGGREPAQLTGLQHAPSNGLFTQLATQGGDRRCGIAGANDRPVDATRTRIKNRLRGDCAPTSQERACGSASKRKLSPSIPYARGEGQVLGHFSARSSRNDRLSHSKKVTVGYSSTYFKGPRGPLSQSLENGCLTHFDGGSVWGTVRCRGGRLRPPRTHLAS